MIQIAICSTTPYHLTSLTLSFVLVMSPGKTDPTAYSYTWQKRISPGKPMCVLILHAFAQETQSTEYSL